MAEKGNAIERMNSRLKTGPNGCWEWQGSLNRDGYGTMKAAKKRYLVHRLMWMIRKGDIPEGLHIDHLCRNKKCANPDHLEPVTPLINASRGFSVSTENRNKTHCLKGHSFSGENLRILKNHRGRNARACRQCHREYMKTYMQNKRKGSHHGPERHH